NRGLRLPVRRLQQCPHSSRRYPPGQAALLTDSTKFFTWASCDTSQGKNPARPFSISFATVLPLASSTSDTATNFAPSFANLRQSARPIPLAPPVTTTVFPLICMPEKIDRSL